MEIKINKLILDNAIETVAKAVDPLPFDPIMKGILISAEDNQIVFSGSDGEISARHTIKTSLDAIIKTPGICLVELSMFRNLVKKLDDDILIKTDEKIMTLSSNLDVFTLNLFTSSDYPDIDYSVYGDTLKINWNKLKNVAKDVWFAASISDADLILNCVNLSVKNKKLTLMATDRFRFAQETVEVNSNDLPNDVSILAKNLKSLMNFNCDDEVTLYVSQNKIAFQLENTVVQSKIVDQSYLDVTNLIPKTCKYKILIDKKELNSILNKVSTITNETNNKIVLEIKNKVMTLSASRSEIASATIKTQNFSFEGIDSRWIINVKYLKDAISVLDGQITFCITGERTCKFLLTSNENPNVVQLFTPQKGY